jgi:hypothetical protein
VKKVLVSVIMGFALLVGGMSVDQDSVAHAAIVNGGTGGCTTFNEPKLAVRPCISNSYGTLLPDVYIHAINGHTLAQCTVDIYVYDLDGVIVNSKIGQNCIDGYGYGYSFDTGTHGHCYKTIVGTQTTYTDHTSDIYYGFYSPPVCL